MSGIITFPRSIYQKALTSFTVVKAFDALKKDLANPNEAVATTALRFTLSNDVVSTVIPGMRRVRNVEANAAVSAAGPLSPETLALLKRHAWSKCFYQ